MYAYLEGESRRSTHFLRELIPIGIWNSLPQTVVQSRNLNSFKSGIDNFLPNIYAICIKRIRVMNTLPIRCVHVQ